MYTVNGAASAKTLAAIVFCGIFLSGCGRSSDTQPVATNGQVVAHVGNEVITIQELDNEFRLANIPADKQKDPQLLKRVLGDLVTRKYLVRQALEAKLDREPSVLLDILRSRDLVLANAMIYRDVAKKASGLTKSEIDQYIANNPAKFSNRQLIAVEQITFPLGTNAQSVIDATRGAKSLDDVDQKLTEMKITHNRSTGSINSAELPESLFDQIQVRKPDDVFFLRAGPNGVFMVVKGEEPRPLGGDAAINTARQGLNADLLKSEIGMASVAANLEAKLEGDYAKLMAQPDQAQTAPQK
ncbi:hypothetical protein [Bradyrhizobium genosp. P]|uniref:hypothetical protein n=1 Tax=Bradyrhizobium genosp. P TaxID=83641 RepID=UPI003CF7BBF7